MMRVRCDALTRLFVKLISAGARQSMIKRVIWESYGSEQFELISEMNRNTGPLCAGH